MSPEALITMIVVLVSIVGGFLYFLGVALRMENRKKKDQDSVS